MADETPTVAQAWSAVMEDVQGIRKSERNKQQGFNFRGIDTVTNAVGPVFRKHGVSVLPQPVNLTLSTYQTSGGTTMHSAVAEMQYTIRGPAGDTMVGGAYGEAADAGDKAVSKAQSVAYRVFLLQGLTIPTDEPDPDTESHQRAAPPPRAAPPEPDGPLPESVLALQAVGNQLTGAERAELRSKLIAAGLPTAAHEMNDDQATAAVAMALALRAKGMSEEANA